MSVGNEKEFKRRLFKCILKQTFLEVDLRGIKKSSIFQKVISSEELSYYKSYEGSVSGELCNVLEKLSCNIEKYISPREALMDLEYLEGQQMIVGYFLREIKKRMRQEMTISQRIVFLWENVKDIFNKKNRGGKGNALVCH